ncbi:MAG: spore coat protein [Firmicutes bacterium]|nr:spore coat protein [Bacillota bacterium]
MKNSKTKNSNQDYEKNIGSTNAAYSGHGGGEATSFGDIGTGSQSKSYAEFASEVCLNDTDIATDLLTTQKGLVKMYGTALTEVSCERLRGLLNTQLTECACDQFATFNYMSENGMYPTEEAPKGKVSETVKQFSKKQI